MYRYLCRLFCILDTKPSGMIENGSDGLLGQPCTVLNIQASVFAFMREFSKLCKEVEDLDPATYTAIITERSMNIIDTLSDIMDDGVDGLTMYMHFLLCSVAADGRLDKSEFNMLKPAMELAMGREIDYQEAQEIFENTGLNRSEDYKAAVEDMVDIVNMVPEIREDVVIVCLLACAVDGKISFKEKQWIKRLID